MKYSMAYKILVDNGTPNVRAEYIFEPKNKDGYREEEIYSALKYYNISHDAYWEAFGVNTIGITKEGEDIYYVCDVLRTFDMIFNKRKMTVEEWD